MKFIQIFPKGLSLLFTEKLQVAVPLSLWMKETSRDLRIQFGILCHIESASCPYKEKWFVSGSGVVSYKCRKFWRTFC